MGTGCRAVELWGGVECTFNRVGDRYLDQLELSGHSERIQDLDLIHGLGVSSIRQPILWERSETSEADFDFSWSDVRLERLRSLALEPIVGLMHHGSGPSHTSLVSSCLPEKLAAFAGAVARRYPWLRRFTPVNEPLTTARFSGLYGHWYPHGRGDRSFIRALLTECKATVLCMAAIREAIPGALLVQTEDMGFTRSTEGLGYQADFENERRWLSFDLLAGRVHRQHPLYKYLLRAGATAEELDYFSEHACPADVLGINYYVTSERFLDGRLELYPASMRGGNARQAYVDVEAVRVCAEGLLGPARILIAAHERYNRPIAITEAHLGSHCTQQMSWLSYVWRAALLARQQGADVRAVTAWALLGAYGWDRLVTGESTRYEPGAFDVSDGVPRKTALAEFVRALADGKILDTEPGWWTEPARLVYPAYHARSRAA